MPALRLSLLLLLLAVPCAHGQTVIRHCLDAQGRPVFTDQPCALLQATPAPAGSSADPVPSPRAPAVTCAADVAELHQAVIDAFAAQDANRLAGLMLWGGYGKHAAVTDIRALAALMRQPVLGIEASPDTGDPGSAAPAQLTVSTVAQDGSGATEQTRFAIERRAGCLWLRQE